MNIEFLLANEEIIALIGYVLTLAFIPIILVRKPDPASAIGWCLVIVFLPYFGVIAYLVLGRTRILRNIELKRRHHRVFAELEPTPEDMEDPAGGWAGISRLASSLGASPPTSGNAVRVYAEGVSAYDAMEEAIASAKHHIYMESFIFKPDESGKRFIALLAERAAEGVKVRLMYDDVGSHRLGRRHLKPLRKAGGEAVPYPPRHRWRNRLQLSIRTHRKVLTVDGEVGFTGGLNIANEYVHQGEFPYWRDTHIRLIGPAVADLERAFVEHWDFVAGERLPIPPASSKTDPEEPQVQIVAGGPEQEINALHAVYFAAITEARKRLWIMSPYFVPDLAIITAIRAAALQGLDVRLLVPKEADHWLSYFAAHYYWDSVLASGVRIFRYQRGMMHSKVIMVDSVWSSVGTANLDIRSLRINFEINALISDPQLTKLLEGQFLNDLEAAEELDLETFSARPLHHKVAENVSRLFSPLL